MGGKSKKEIVTMIKNEVNVRIANHTQNINNIINETITNVNSKMVNDTAVSLSMSSGGSAMISIAGGLKVGGGSTFTIDQQVSITATNKAVATITNNIAKQAELATKLQNDITNKLSNSSQAQADLKAVNVLKNIETNEGGDALIGKGLDTLNNMVSSLTGKEEEESVRKNIENIINQSIENTTINSNTFKDIVQNNINTDIINKTLGECKIDTSANAIVTIGGSVEISEASTVAFKQIASVNAMNECILNAISGTDIVDKISKEAVNTTASDTSNTASAEAAMAAQNEDVTENKQGSAMVAIGGMIADVVGKLGMGVIVLVIVVIIGIGFLLFKFGPGLLFAGSFTKGGLRSSLQIKPPAPGGLGQIPVKFI